MPGILVIESTNPALSRIEGAVHLRNGDGHRWRINMTGVDYRSDIRAAAILLGSLDSDITSEIRWTSSDGIVSIPLGRIRICDRQTEWYPAHRRVRPSLIAEGRKLP